MTLDLDRLAELDAAATPGPWHVGVGVDEWDIRTNDIDAGAAAKRADADLIVAMRNTLPALIAAARNDPQPLLDELREQLRELGDRANDDAANAISDEAAEYFGGKAVAFLRAAELVQAALDKAREAK